MSVLVTGGAGYIGSHAVKRLLEDGHRVVSVDNLFRGHREAMDALAPIAQPIGMALALPGAVLEVTHDVMRVIIGQPVSLTGIAAGVLALGVTAWAAVSLTFFALRLIGCMLSPWRSAAPTAAPRRKPGWSPTILSSPTSTATTATAWA